MIASAGSDGLPGNSWPISGQEAGRRPASSRPTRRRSPPFLRHARSTIVPMARSRQPSLPDPKKPELVVPREQLEIQLAERIERGRDLRGRPIHSEDDLKSARADYYTWDEFNKTLLRRSFSTETIAEQEYNPPIPVFGFGDTPLHQKVEFFYDDLDRRLRELDSIRGQLSLYEPLITRYETATSVATSRTQIFLVHGHDVAARAATERFIQKCAGIDPIVLRDQPNGGRTVIEKFEDEAEKVGFAIVLLTGDDDGGLRGRGEHKPRARQNVVFELGFFIGQLGRERVAVLYEENVELPSDMSGVLYTEYDESGAWQVALARELKAASFQIDLNALL